MRLPSLAAFCLPVVSVVAAWFAASPVYGDDQKQIQGTWECVETLKEGRSVRDYVGVRAVLEGNRLTWLFPKPDGTYTAVTAKFTLDPTQDPKHFDWVADAKPQETHRRLYRLEGDVLKWSTDLGLGPRPKSFAEGKWQFTMKRIVDQ